MAPSWQVPGLLVLTSTWSVPALATDSTNPPVQHARWTGYRDQSEIVGGLRLGLFAAARTFELERLAIQARQVGAAIPSSRSWGLGLGFMGAARSTAVGITSQLGLSLGRNARSEVNFTSLWTAFELQQDLLELPRWIPYAACSIGIDLQLLRASGAATQLFDPAIVGGRSKFTANRSTALLGFGLGHRVRLTVNHGYSGDSGSELGFELGRWVGLSSSEWDVGGAKGAGPDMGSGGWYLKLTVGPWSTFRKHEYVPVEMTTSCLGPKCELECDAGWANCDGLISNGCETALDTEEHCGSCGEVCAENQSCKEARCVP